MGQWVEPEKAIRAKQLRREMTPAERCLWARLRMNQLGGLHFRRQQVIDGFIADFYCHGVEVDGPVHEAQADFDTERDRVLEALGLTVVRVRNHDVIHDIQSVLAAIETVSRTRLVTPDAGEAQ